MSKLWIAYLLISVVNADVIYAQWTEVDSLWLKSMVEGKDSIRLNSETMRAIEEGTFLNGENPFAQPLDAPLILPITRDFWDIRPEDTLAVDYDSLAPAAFNRFRRMREKDSLSLSEAFRLRLKFHEQDEFQIGQSPFAVSAGAKSLFDDTVKDGQRRGCVGGSVGVRFSLDDLLMYVFRPSERRKRKNKKKAENLKYYNATP